VRQLIAAVPSRVASVFQFPVLAFSHLMLVILAGYLMQARYLVLV
jgi:hypothetical protein